MKSENLFYERLIQQVQLRNKTVNQVERELGYPRNALHNYKTTRIPSAERLFELSDYFGIDPQYLFGKTEKPIKKEIKLIFSQLSASEKKEMLALCCEWFISQTKV